MPAQQSYATHTRFDPLFHFVLAPVLAANIVLSIYLTVRDWPAHVRSHIWAVLMALSLYLLFATIRRYGAKNQDRIIRLEERLRLSALLPPADAGIVSTFATRQLIALRFASDAELPALARRAALESLSAAQIKKAIIEWRPDDERI